MLDVGQRTPYQINISGRQFSRKAKSYQPHKGKLNMKYTYVYKKNYLI